MVRPEDLKQVDSNETERIISEIDRLVKKTHGSYPYEQAILSGEIPMTLRNEIAFKYINEGGWNYVYHITSSENHEKYGLTQFILSMNPLNPTPSNMIMVEK